MYGAAKLKDTTLIKKNMFYIVAKQSFRVGTRDHNRNRLQSIV